MVRHPVTRALWTVALMVLATLPAHAQQSDTSTPMPEAPTPTVLDNPDLVQRYQATITPEDLAAHLYVFASDYFEGRETTAPGQKLAATYLAGQYRTMGLAPKGTVEPEHPFAPEAYFQPFDLHGQRLQAATLEVLLDGQTAASAPFGLDGASDDAFLLFGSAPESEGGVVFGGYGIADDNLGYNDYAALKEKDIDYTGKWLILLANEPLASAEASLLPTEDGTPSRWTTSRFDKLRHLLSSGTMPAGVLIVGDVGPRGVNIAEEAAKQATALRTDVGSLSLTPPDGGRRGFPSVIYTISTDLANQILAPSGRTVGELQEAIDERLASVVFEVPDVTVKSTITQETFTASTENVIAFIEGSDPVLKNEVVVLSSHYDHVGVDPTNEEDSIFNGADDDGSGTVAILEMAEAFQQAQEDGFGPRRSILFLNVSGEEKGLLGSSYFTDTEPVVPLDQVVTNLNIDMIGRFDPTHPTQSTNYVYIIGSKLISQELHDLNAQVNEVTGVDLELDERFNSKDDPNQFYRRSDHWNFGKHSIPFIFFFTGTHEDYHGVDDEAHKIEYDRMARIARLIFATAWQVANQDAPPAVTGTGFN